MSGTLSEILIKYYLLTTELHKDWKLCCSTFPMDQNIVSRNSMIASSHYWLLTSGRKGVDQKLFCLSPVYLRHHHFTLAGALYVASASIKTLCWFSLNPTAYLVNLANTNSRLAEFSPAGVLQVDPDQRRCLLARVIEQEMLIVIEHACMY